MVLLRSVSNQVWVVRSRDQGVPYRAIYGSAITGISSQVFTTVFYSDYSEGWVWECKCWWCRRMLHLIRVHSFSTHPAISRHISSIALDKMHFSIQKYWYFSYFSTKTYVVGTHLKCLVEVLLMSTHNHMFSWRNKKNICTHMLWVLIRNAMARHFRCFCGEIRKIFLPDTHSFLHLYIYIYIYSSKTYVVGTH